MMSEILPGRARGFLVLSAAMMSLFAPMARAEQVVNKELGFSLRTPEGYVSAPERIKDKNVWIYCWVKDNPSGAGQSLLIRKMGGVLSHRHAELSEYPPEKKIKLLRANWNGYSIDVVEVPEANNGVAVLNYNILIPLSPQAIMLSFAGPESQKTELLKHVGSVLGSLKGESNWVRALAVKTDAKPSLPSADEVDALLRPDCFKDPQTGVQIRLPKEWVPIEGNKSTGFSAQTRDRVPAGGLAPYVLIDSVAVPNIKPSDIQGLIDFKNGDNRKKLEDYTIMPPTAAPIVANRAAGVLNAGFIYSKTMPLRMIQLWVIGEEKAYSVTFTSLQATYDANEKTFLASLSTIKFE